MNKQKLPKHIIAFECVNPEIKGTCILKNKTTGLFFSSYKDDSQMLEFSVGRLNDGYGWAYEPKIIGKQIVF